LPPHDGPVIDAHHHLWTVSPGSHPWMEGRAFHRDLAAADYDRTFAGDHIAATVWIEALAADPMAELAGAEALRRATAGRIGAALIGHVPLDAGTWRIGSTPAWRSAPPSGASAISFRPTWRARPT
jgi:predicted TIM-barrel fold metal-dependent hydrolase